MHIDACFSADFRDLRLRYDEKNEMRMATIGLDLALGAETSERIFGDLVSRMAFGHMSDDGELAYDSIKPRVATQEHALEVMGHKCVTVPSLSSLKRSAKFPGVLARLNLPVVASAALIGDLATVFGGSVDVCLAPAQMELIGGEA